MINPRTALIVLAGTYSIVKLYKENRALTVALDESVLIVMYFAELLNRHNIMIDDFDLIVMNSFLEGR